MARQYENTETRRQQLAEAALRTIIEDGVSRFTTRAVAKRVGISDGTLFRHFSSKQEIVLEAMGLLDIEIEKGLVETGDALADLEHFFRHRAFFVGAQDAVGALVFSNELVHLAGDEGRARIAKWRNESIQYLRARLLTLNAAGRTAPTLTIPGMAMLVQGALLTFVMHRSLNPDDTDEALGVRVEGAWQTLKSALFVD